MRRPSRSVALPYRAWKRRWAATCRPRRPTSRRAPRRGRAGGSTHPAHCQGDKRVNSTLIGTSCVRVFAVCQPVLHHNGKMARGKRQQENGIMSNLPSRDEGQYCRHALPIECAGVWSWSNIPTTNSAVLHYRWRVGYLKDNPTSRRSEWLILQSAANCPKSSWVQMFACIAHISCLNSLEDTHTSTGTLLYSIWNMVNIIYSVYI